MQENVSRLFEAAFGSAPTSVEQIAADGSRRRYWRLTGGPQGSVVGAWGPDPDENRAFLSFTRTFLGLGLPVPELYAVDEVAGVWLLEDLGSRTLLATLNAARAGKIESEQPVSALAKGAPVDAGDIPGEFPGTVLPIYRSALELLPRFQLEGGRSIDFSVAYPCEAFDGRSMRWDLNYFKYHFLKLARLPFHERRLEDDFDALVAYLREADGSHFLYRDFQSRNIMVQDGEPRFIDYQGGRRGALAYDVASLLYDGKAAIPESVRLRLLAHYLDGLAGQMAFDRAAFEEQFRGFVLIRIMQAMGAYGYRGFFERKPLFLESIPHQARNLAGLLETGLPLPLPELESVFRRIVDGWAGGDAETGPGECLTVTLTSFSYRDGYPEDTSGHGGGFVFDCRSLPNPGRSPEFADQTGLDLEVRGWLEQTEELGPFRARVVDLLDRHVENYVNRRFSDLAVSFGCTGGQHRSVYMTEWVGRHLRERYPQVEVRVIHREERRWPERVD